MKNLKISFKSLFLLLGLVPLVVALIIISVQSTSSLTSEMERGIYEKLNASAQGLAKYYEYDIEHGKLDLDDYVDCLKSQDIELTLFEEDTRISTSIFKDGTTERNIGTTADPQIYSDVKNGNIVEKDGVIIGGEEYYVSYVPMYANGEFWGMAFAGTPSSSVTSAISGMTRKLSIIAGCIAVVFITLIVVIARILVKPIKKVVESLSKLSEGNISESEKVSFFVKELNDINNSVVILQENLNDTITGIKNTARILSSAVNEVDGLSEANATGVGQISQAVSELSITANHMAESVESTANQTVEMGNNIEDIAENVKTLSNSSKEIKTANNEAREYMNTVLSSSDESVEAVNSISSQISATNEAIKNINEAVAIITSISDQTNLLSLNASIEAARAGEHGRGFAVVAGEIGKLAEQSKEGAMHIQQIASEIEGMSLESVKKAEDIQNIISKEQGYIKETQEKFDILASNVEESILQIESIADKAKLLETVKERITGYVSDLSAISEENAASNEEVTASCSAISDGVSDTRARSEEMAAMSSQLEGLVEYYR